MTYLVDHPDGFRKAFGLIRPDLRGLYLSAFQSAVWNRMLAVVVRDTHADLQTSRIADAQVPLGCRSASSAVAVDRLLPLVSARSKNLSSQDRDLAEQALDHYGMKLSGMKLSYPRDRFFSRANRSCWLCPHRVTAESGDDELYDGYQQVCLEFELPSGSYATMLIRCLTQVVESTES